MNTTLTQRKAIAKSVIACGTSATARKFYPNVDIKKARYKVRRICLKTLPTCSFKGEGKNWKSHQWPM